MIYTIVGLTADDQPLTERVDADTPDEAASLALSVHDLDEVIAVFEGELVQVGGYRCAEHHARYVSGARFEGRKEHEVTFIDTYGHAAPLRMPVIDGFQRHSPTGFSWGHGGSGPADLALAILHRSMLYMTGSRIRADDYALRYHQSLKWDVIAHMDHSAFTLSVRQVMSWLDTRVVKVQRLMA